MSFIYKSLIVIVLVCCVAIIEFSVLRHSRQENPVSFWLFLQLRICWHKYSPNNGFMYQFAWSISIVKISSSPITSVHHFLHLSVLACIIQFGSSCYINLGFIYILLQESTCDKVGISNNKFDWILLDIEWYSVASMESLRKVKISKKHLNEEMWSNCLDFCSGKTLNWV